MIDPPYQNGENYNQNFNGKSHDSPHIFCWILGVFNNHLITAAASDQPKLEIKILQKGHRDRLASIRKTSTKSVDPPKSCGQCSAAWDESGGYGGGTSLKFKVLLHTPSTSRGGGRICWYSHQAFLCLKNIAQGIVNNDLKRNKINWIALLHTVFNEIPNEPEIFMKTKNCFTLKSERTDVLIATVKMNWQSESRFNSTHLRRIWNGEKLECFISSVSKWNAERLDDARNSWQFAENSNFCFHST